MATNAELHKEVHGLRIAVLDLAEAMSGKAETTDVVPREELNQRLRRSGRRVAAGMLLLLLIIVIAVASNRVTLSQAQDQAAADIANLIQTCRATSPTLTPQDLAYCEKRIPGFAQSRVNVARTVATAKENEARLRHLEVEVAALKRR